MKLLLPLLATTAAQSSQLYIEQRSLQATSRECSSLIDSMVAADTDRSGGLSRDEYYTFLSSQGVVGSASAYAELELVLKVSRESLACYCTVLGGGEGCCVGSDAEINLTVLRDPEAVASGVAGQYESVVCETVGWATGISTDTEAVTTTIAPKTTEVVETTEFATTSGGTEPTVDSSTAGATEASVATIAAQDGSLIFTAITSTIDFASYSPQPESYDEFTYYNAEEVLNNVDFNGILEDMQRGFVGLALDVFSMLDASELAATSAIEDATIPTTTAAEIYFLTGSNLTTEVEDVVCPTDLVYAPKGAPCMSFNYSITPPTVFLNDTSVSTSFADSMTTSISEGKLYAKVVKNNPKTLVTGSGDPGGSGESFDSKSNRATDSVEEEQSNSKEFSRLSIGAIVGIIVAVFAVPIA